jgi:hypothetical protein
MEQSLPHERSVYARSCPVTVPMVVEPNRLDALTAAAETVGIAGGQTNEGGKGQRRGLYDKSGNELCLLCRDRLNRRDRQGRLKPSRGWGVGHAHDSCVSRRVRRTSSEANFDSSNEPQAKRVRRQDEEQHAARERAITALRTITRTLKRYSEVKRTQRTERWGILSDVLRGLGMTLEELAAKFVLSPDKCAAFDNHQLKALREVLPMPAHTTINKVRISMAEEFGCGTEAFTTAVRGESNPVHVAYVTDPMKLLTHFKHLTPIIEDRPWECVVGVDKCGDLTDCRN